MIARHKASHGSCSRSLCASILRSRTVCHALRLVWAQGSAHKRRGQSLQTGPAPPLSSQPGARGLRCLSSGNLGPGASEGEGEGHIVDASHQQPDRSADTLTGTATGDGSSGSSMNYGTDTLTGTATGDGSSSSSMDPPTSSCDDDVVGVMSDSPEATATFDPDDYRRASQDGGSGSEMSSPLLAWQTAEDGGPLFPHTYDPGPQGAAAD